MCQRTDRRSYHQQNVDFVGKTKLREIHSTNVFKVRCSKIETEVFFSASIVAVKLRNSISHNFKATIYILKSRCGRRLGLSSLTPVVQYVQDQQSWAAPSNSSNASTRLQT